MKNKLKKIGIFLSVILVGCTNINPSGPTSKKADISGINKIHTSLTTAELAELDKKYSFGIKVISDSYVGRALRIIANEAITGAYTDAKKTQKIRQELEYFLYRKGTATHDALCSAGSPTILHNDLLTSGTNVPAGVNDISSETDPEFVAAINSPCDISGSGDPIQTGCNYTGPTGIVGGTNAAPGEFPFTVQIKTGANCGCTGAILSSNYVITSAHCVDGKAAANIQVIAGVYQRSDLTGTQSSAVTGYTMHEQYNVGIPTYANDLAIITLQTPLTMGGNVQPATLPADNTNNYAGLTVVSSAWGSADTMQKASIQVISTAETDNLLASIAGYSAWDNHIGLYDAANNIMAGADSVTYGPDGVTRLFGIGSFSSDPSHPSVGTRVSAYLDWITANTP